MLTIDISQELEHKLAERAHERHITIESFVGEALDWYPQVAPDVVDELPV